MSPDVKVKTAIAAMIGLCVLVFWGFLALLFMHARLRSERRDRGKKPLIFLTSLTSRKNPDYYAGSMQASRFSFAFTYRYFFTGSGEADGVLNMLK